MNLYYGYLFFLAGVGTGWLTLGVALAWLTPQEDGRA